MASLRWTLRMDFFFLFRFSIFRIVLLDAFTCSTHSCPYTVSPLHTRPTMYLPPPSALRRLVPTYTVSPSSLARQLYPHTIPFRLRPHGRVILTYHSMHYLHTAQSQYDTPYVLHLCAMDTELRIVIMLQSLSHALKACLQHFHKSRVLQRCGNALFVV